jgi:hypothetical protein
MDVIDEVGTIPRQHVVGAIVDEIAASACAASAITTTSPSSATASGQIGRLRLTAVRNMLNQNP